MRGSDEVPFVYPGCCVAVVGAADWSEPPGER